MAKKKAVVIGPVPTTLIDVNAQIDRIGELGRRYESVEAERDQKIAALKTKFATKLGDIAQSLASETAGLEAYAKANRVTILPKDAKSVAFASGVIGWRFTPTKVTFGRGGAKKALAYLREHRMLRFIRIIREVNKERLLQDRPAIPGVKYDQKEEFFVTPLDERETHEVQANVMVVKKK